MKHLITLATSLLISLTIMAQDTVTVEGPWTYNGLTSLHFSQVSLTNWVQGGESSYAINGLAALNFNYTEDRNSWANTIDIGYGIQKIGEKDPAKTDDHMELLSKYGRQLSGNWFFSGMLNFKTQFTKGYNQTDADKILISDLLSPGYLLFSLGMEYKKDDSFYVLLSPATSKITMVVNDSLSDAGSFGVDPGKTTRPEFGGSIKIGLNKDLMENVNLTSTLDLFSNYFENPQNIDISWKALINMKINEYLSANISTHLVYDDDIECIDSEGIKCGPKVQFKEMLGIGFSYKF
ncbi:MAG: DUF3078 domain-containing protein [Bacteroidales bacterium]|nr:DUF3078 domain-containing protein [Bacteroidales bacterium]